MPLTLAQLVNGEHPLQMTSYYMGLSRSFGTFIGGRAADASEVDELLEIFNSEILSGFPDTFGFASRAPIFEGSRGGRQINLDMQAESFESLLAAGPWNWRSLNCAWCRMIAGFPRSDGIVRVWP